MKSALWISLCMLLAFAARTSNVRDVFIDGGIYFVDADCYSRMTRAQFVSEHPGAIIDRHRFENFPVGTTPHTTAPLDYLIVGLKGVLDLAFRTSGSSSVLRTQTLDLAGALVSPLLGVLTCCFLGWWASGCVRRSLARPARAPSGEPPRLAWSIWRPRRKPRPAPAQPNSTDPENAAPAEPPPPPAVPTFRPLRHWAVTPFFFAVSPILVHGASLGRPDHQSLVISFLCIALAAELVLAERPSRAWGVTAGAAWVMALWVSFYEPLILLIAVLLLWMIFARRRLWVAERRFELIAFGSVLILAILLEGWRFSWPDPEFRDVFGRWKGTVGELKHLDLRSPLLYKWLGLGILASPLLLALVRKEDRRVLPLLVLLVLTLCLTMWQLRWGYFLALIFAMSLPWQLMMLRKTWLVWLLLIASLWPLLGDWDRRLFSSEATQRQKALRAREQILLREMAESMRSDQEAGFLGPWWLSPAVAYWSGQPGVAGSSHQSLPGIVDSARFYLAADESAAARILERRKVQWVISDDASRVVGASAALLGSTPPPQPFGRIISEHPSQAPAFLTLEAELGGGFGTGEPVFYRLYRVDRAQLVTD